MERDEASADVSTASREALLAVIAAQRDVIATLERRVAAPEERLKPGGPKGMPGLKPGGSTRTNASGGTRKRRAPPFVRRRSQPTRRERHAAAACPGCGTRLAGGRVVRRREVIDLPPTPAEVVEHQIVARHCPVCERDVVPVAPLAGVVDGKQRLGVGLVSLIATLREVGRLPVRTIQWYLRTAHQLCVSVGSIIAASARVAATAREALAAIRQRVRGSPVVHADETGWRENGHNGSVWTFATPTARSVVRGSRHTEMVDTALGPDFTGVLSSDFYAAYHHHPGQKQRCWAHLLREIHELAAVYPTGAALAAWATAAHALYREAVSFTATDPHRRLLAHARFERCPLTICQPGLTDRAVTFAKLCRRIERHLSELFVFVAHPDVPPDNNAAERSPRPLVTSRKVSGGTRSPAGTATNMTLASLFGSWAAQGRDPFSACHQLLAASQA